MSWPYLRRPLDQKARRAAGLLFCASLRARIAALAFVLPLAACEPRELGQRAQTPAVHVVPVARAEIASALQLDGEVALLGAWQLTSADHRFGGFSGLLVDDGRLFLLSDRGHLWSVGLAPDEPLPIRDGTWQVVELAVAGRRPDAEDLARTGDGTLWVAIEGEHALAPLARPAGSDRVDLVPRRLPEPIASLPANGGIEALAALGDGSLLALAETRRGAGHPALLLTQSGTEEFSYPAQAGFAPTAAAWIASHLLVLERRFTLLRGFAARLVAWPVATAADLPLDNAIPRVLALSSPSWAIDNLEGLAAEPPDRDGAVRIWLVSDDNFSRWQRTLLVLLRWQPQPALARASSRRLSGMSSSGSSASDTLLK